MADVLAAVEHHLAAFNDRALDAVVAGFDPEGVFATADQIVVGRRALRTLFADAFAAPVTASLHLRRALGSGDTVACELVERLTAAGATQELDVAAFYTVRAGLLARVRVYRDVPG